MNEIEQQHFDYSLVDNETAIKLKKYDKQLNKIYNNYTIEVGEILYNANQEFSNPKDGTFIKWVEYKGFKRQSAYNYMNIFKAFQNLEGIEKQEIFLSQPKSLQYEMSKPSTNKSVNEAVYNGDIKTHKEYKELERQLKQRDEQNAQLQSRVEQAQRSEEIAKKQLEDAESREPEIKREVKEVIPPHVKAQLSDRQQMIDAKDKEIKQLQEQLSKAEEQKQKFEKQDYLEEDEQIASINFQVESTVLEIKDNINRFLNENASTAFREAAIARASKKTKNQIYDGVEELEAFCRTMRQSLNSNVIVGG
ncbi:hypothetical protein MXE62_10155 [Staphylococcus haemolyticus]|uniref:hypothetical protein n=1 Tax=Staphylococcus haemolyticus TaxID=1283 RepID=UPI002DBD790F|nr:hypothetical protein [Staphylococcus haemolyticus]MEB5828524.1 hypothetical protein [Staphylococcus haemolyticus]